MRKKCAFLLLILLSLGIVAALAACSPAVEIASIAISENSGNYKTEYLVGEELNIEGIVLLVTRTDGETYEVFATDVRQDLRILNFSTQKPADRVSVVLEYKNVSTSYDISVKSEEAGTVRYTLSFDSMGGSAVEPQSIVAYGRATEPSLPVREGYRFMGWYTESSFNNQFNFSTAQITSDTLLYARWARLYTISFYSDDNVTLITTREVEAGGTLSDIPGVPAREGYEAAWSRTVFTGINSDIRVNAVYTRLTFTVTFSYRDEDGRTLIEVGRIEKVPYGTDLYAEAGAEINDYLDDVPAIVGNREFARSWDPAAESSLHYVIADIYAEAVFNTISYTVTYYWNYPDGAGDPMTVYGTPVKVQYNTPIRTAPADPVLEGYRFDGWFRQTGATIKWNFTNDLVERNTSLSAGWTKLYNVSRYVPSAIIPPSDGAEKVTFKGEEYWLYSYASVPAGGTDALGSVPFTEGYKGIWLDKNGDAATQASLSNVSSDISVYAAYEKNLYTVNFYASDRETVVASQTVAYKEYASEPSEIPLLTGYSFAGWDFDFGSEIVSDTNVYPTYTANKYMVSFYESDSDTSFTQQEVVYGSNVVLPTPAQRTDYRFAGWFTERGGTEEWTYELILTAETLAGIGVIDSADAFDYMPSDVVLKLYATWIRQYSIIFLDDTGSNIDTLYVDAGSILTSAMAPDIEERAGYTGSWHVADEYNAATEQEYNFGAQIAGPVKLRIVYDINKYEVTFRIDFVNSSGIVVDSALIPDIDGHDPDANLVVSVKYNETVLSSKPEFVLPVKADVAGLIMTYGGYQQNELDGAEFSWTDEGMIAAPITSNTVIAAKCRVNRFTVAWYADEAATVLLYSVETDFHASARLPQNIPEPTREGYTFVGFRATPEGSDNLDVDRDIVFVPLFSINSYNLRFITEGNEELAQTDYLGNSMTLPVNYRYNTVIALTSGISGYHESVSFGGSAGTDFLGWRKDMSGTRLYFDPAIGKWYLPGGEGDDVSTASYLFVTEKGNFLVRNTAGDIATLILNDTWSDYAENVYYTDGSWFTDTASGSVLVGNGSGSLIPAGLFYVISGPTLFYSVTEATRYTVSYVTNIDGYEIEPTRVVYNSLLTAPKASAEGKVFIAWYSDEKFTELYDFSVPVASDITLYAAWEDITEGTEGVVYSLNDNGTEAFVKDYTGTEVNVIIANFYEGVPVTQIGTEAFADTDIVSVTLPDTVSYFGPGAFENTRLVEITVPQRVTIIPDNCFRDCRSLTTIKFREGSELSVIGSYAFAGCESLKLNTLISVDASGNAVETESASFPSSLTEIREGAFMNAAVLRRVFFPASLQRLEYRAFFDTFELMYVVFDRAEPAVLGEEVFLSSGLSYLNFRVYVPDVARYTAGGAGWSGLTEKIVSKNNITTDTEGGLWSYEIEPSMPDSLILLQFLGDDRTGASFDVTVPSKLPITGQSGQIKDYTVVGLGSNVFSSLIGSVTFNSNISIKEDTFVSASKLTNLTIVRDDLWSSGYTLSADALYAAYSASDSLYSLTLVNPNITAERLFGRAMPSKITFVSVYGTTDFALPDYMFENQAFVITVNIGEHVTGIGVEAFSGATALSEICFTDGNSLSSISASAFAGAISLTTVRTLTEQGYKDGIPSVVSTVGNGAFDGVPWVEGYIDENGFTMLGAGILYSYSGKESLVKVPENTIAVSPNAFENNSYIKLVVLGENVKQIGEYAFANAVNLESVYVSGANAVIGGYAFANSSKLSVLIVGGSATVAETALTGTLYDSGELSLYAESSLSVGSLAAFVVSNINYDGATGWIYATYDNERTLLKYFGDSTELISTPQGTQYLNIGDYAFTRGAKAIAVDTALVPIGRGQNPFGGLTALENIILNVNRNGVEDPSDSLRSGNGDQNILYKLFSVCDGTVALTVNASAMVAEVMGQSSGKELPVNLKVVNIDIAGVTRIPDSFLEDAVGVSAIFVVDGSDSYALEQAEDALGGIAIGGAAFRGTGWMNSRDSDFVFIGGMLIEVRTSEPVVRISAEATSINGYAFSGTAAETIYIPAGVSEISANAFSGAEGLSRLVLPDRTGGAPALTDGSVLNGISGMSVFYSGTGDYSVWGYGISGTYNLTDNVYDEEREISFSADIRVKAHYLISTSGTLFMYRVYTESASGEYLGEVTDVDIPETLMVTAAGSTVSNPVRALGVNVLGSAVTKVGIYYSVSAEADALGNLSELSQLRILGVNPDSRRLTASALRGMIDAHNVNNLVYNGSVTLNELLDGNSGVLTKLTSISIEDGTVETVNELLKGWDHISSVTFPSSIRKVGVNSLENTAWYASASRSGGNVILGGVLYYKYYIAGTGGSTDVVIPANVVVVNTAAFAKATVNGGEVAYSSAGLSVKQIRFEPGSKLETVLEYAFAYCQYLENVSLPGTVVSVAESAFTGTMIVSNNGALIINSSSGGKVLVKYTGSASEYIVPFEVQYIAPGAFEGNESLTALKLERGSLLTYIGDGAFKDCVNLASLDSDLVTLSTLTYVGREAFLNTAWLDSAVKDVKFGNSVNGYILYRKIESYSGNWELGSDLKSVSPGAFEGMTGDGGITGVSLPKDVAVSAAELKQLLSDPGITALTVYGNVALSSLIGGGTLDNITSVSIYELDDADSITDEFLYGWESVTSVNIPNKVKRIGARAFDGTAWMNGRITSATDDYIVAANPGILLKYLGSGSEIVELSENIKGIAADAFAGNEVIVSVNMQGTELSEIPAGAFAGCSALTGIILPATVIVIGAGAFDGVGEGFALTFTGSDPGAVSVADGVFDAVDEIRVPAAYIEKYRYAWSEVLDKIVGI